MNDATLKLFMSLTDVQLLGLCIRAEAEGERATGQMAVGFVIMNRCELWDKSPKTAIKRVILAKNQFESFNAGNPRLNMLVEEAANITLGNPIEEITQRCIILAEGVISKACLSNVGKSTFFKAVGHPSPWFDRSITKGTIQRFRQIGKHEFFVERRFL